MASTKVCQYPLCETAKLAKGYCSKHYYRLNRHGNPSHTVHNIDSIRTKIESRVEMSAKTGCWLWLGALNSQGYAKCSWRGRRDQRVHVLAYEEYVGAIPEGLIIDHKCRNRACVNPEHLQAISQAKNMQNLGNTRNSRSGIRGVSWCSARSKWLARATVGGVIYGGGYHDTIEDAEAEVIALRMKHMTNNLADRLTAE